MHQFNKRSIQLVVAIAATGFGIALIITAFFVPPMGTIDPTVLTAYGETLTFAGALIGIDYRYRDHGPRDNKTTRLEEANPLEQHGKEDEDAA